MTDDLDVRPEAVVVRPEPMIVAEFEGEPVRIMEGRLPALSLEMEQGYPRGTHLVLNIEVRVRNVRYEEDRRGDLSRLHVFALEEAKLLRAFDPAVEVTNVGGTAAGDAWMPALLAYIYGQTDTIEGDFGDVPERLKLLIEDSELREAYPDRDIEPVSVHHEVGF